MRTSITVEEALKCLADRGILRDRSIEGALLLDYEPLAVKGQDVRKRLRFENCFIKIFGADGLVFHRPVSLRACEIRRTGFCAAYFFRGLEILACEFHELFYFGAGGHNRPGYPIRMVDCIFHEFVDFDDCYFEGPVEVMNCRFEKGTNLLHFVQQPFGLNKTGSLRVEGNVGDLDLKTTTAQTE